MLDPGLKTPLKGYLERLQRPIELVASVYDSAKSQELLALLQDIASLNPLVSLTLHKTKVTDLSPLSGSALQRLHIGETPVTDLTPLKGLSLTRLVFTPASIKTGLEVARSLPVQEIGTKFDEEGRDLMPPEAFWAQQGK